MPRRGQPVSASHQGDQWQPFSDWQQPGLHKWMDHRQRGLWKSDRCGRLKWPPNFGPVFDIGLGAAPVAPDAARGDEANETEDGRGAEHFPVWKNSQLGRARIAHHGPRDVVAWSLISGPRAAGVQRAWRRVVTRPAVRNTREGRAERVRHRTRRGRLVNQPYRSAVARGGRRPSRCAHPPPTAWVAVRSFAMRLCRIFAARPAGPGVKRIQALDLPGAPYGTERTATETSIKRAFLRLSAERVIPPSETTGNWRIITKSTRRR